MPSLPFPDRTDATMRTLSRRDFLIQSAATGLALSAGGLDALADTTPASIKLIKGPYLQLTGLNHARLRFETPARHAQPVGVRLERKGQAGIEQLTTLRLDKVRYKWPTKPVRKHPPKAPDERGQFTIHDATFDKLQPGETYRWVVDCGNGREVSGEFIASPPRDTPFRLGWIADTRQPRNKKTTAQLIKLTPDLVLHGGDLQYQSDPRDTWNGLLLASKGLLERAPFHACPGNHEYEAMAEFDAQFVRLFEGQGESGGAGFHAFTYAGIRFVMLNSERGLKDPDGPQARWLERELANTQRDDTLRFAIVALHHPIFSFSKRQPTPSIQTHVHKLCRQYQVPLVLNGHNHCYERFEVDGIHYVTDGGGGASLYKPDHYLSRYERRHREQLTWRKKAEESHGISLYEIAADGTFTLTRVRMDGTLTERVTLG